MIKSLATFLSGPKSTFVYHALNTSPWSLTARRRVTALALELRSDHVLLWIHINIPWLFGDLLYVAVCTCTLLRMDLYDSFAVSLFVVDEVTQRPVSLEVRIRLRDLCHELFGCPDSSSHIILIFTTIAASAQN